MKHFLRLLFVGILFVGLHHGTEADGAEPTDGLEQGFHKVVQPFLKSYCLDCHSHEDPEAKLDLSGASSLKEVTQNHQIWKTILDRIEANEMPPAEHTSQPEAFQRKDVADWIRAMREHEAHRNAGDPGIVLARRLNNSEYNYTIRDLTGVDIQPAKTFPIDPANTAGFDNSGESLTMSPALLNKYLAAARQVSEYMVLTPTNITFAPHPVVTETDRDKYCVKRIVEFYARQPTDLADYFFACWRYGVTRSAEAPESDLSAIATELQLSPKYAEMVWDVLHTHSAAGPLKKLQEMFEDIKVDAESETVHQACEMMRDYILEIRPRFSKTFKNLEINEVHKGSQSFVLWKNEQYAANRRNFDNRKLFNKKENENESDEIPEGTPDEFILPADQEQQQRFLDSIELFCSVFPDTFYVAERGRDYLGVSKENQEKGRLLSAGFHSMMGYFRDDAPLYELILSESQQTELDQLWQELDFVTFAPRRQYLGFLWFERTDSRYMRDPEFDFARAEDQNAASQEMISRLSDVYLAKAKRNGGEGVALKALADYFENINEQIRWVETEQLKSQPRHLELLLQFAAKAWRRNLQQQEQQQILDFYKILREQDHLDHVEAMRDSVVSIIMSPHFLYRTDLISLGDGTRALSAFELANRLSYFLWSTSPDFELRRVQGDLQDSNVLLQQTRRMLDDEHIVALATEFAANWLDIRRFEEHNSVDRDRFPEFTNELRAAMFQEPIHFFIDLVRHDRSILDLLNARDTFVNPVLAKHYGMNDVSFVGNEWQKVHNADVFDRGGLLGMSVFMTKNSPGLRTSPVKRGYWVARRILGERIPPPPPNVPDLPEDESQLGDLSLREILARHRDHKSCAGCHDRFDAIGLAFEGFGPIGERRLKDLGDHPVDTVADFPGGTQGTGLEGVRTYLMEHRQAEFVDNFCRKLLIYALGRTLLLSDEPLLETMKLKLQVDDYRFSSLVESIVTSPQFLTKRGNQKLSQEF